MITSASSAMGAQQKTDGVGVAVLEDVANGVNAVSHPGNAVAAWNANDSFFINTANDVVIGANGNGATVAAIDNFINSAGRTITIAENSSITSIINSTGVQTASLVVNDGKQLQIGGAAGIDAGGNAAVVGDLSALGDVVLGSGAGGSVLSFKADSIVAGKINSDVAVDGQVEILAGNNVIFNGELGTTKKLGLIHLDGAASKATFNKNVISDALNLNHATAEATIGAGVTIAADVVATKGADEGKLNFAGSATMTKNIGMTGGKELNRIKLNGDANSTVILQGDVAATTVEIGAGTLQLADTKTIHGLIEATVANAGKLHFDKAGGHRQVK